jgi:hypothetical protein
MKRCLIPTDRQKMVQFISSQLPDGEGRLILADGSRPGDDIIADVTVFGDDLEIQSNCPEWVSVREIYEHLHWRSMLGWEQKVLLQNEVLASRTAALQKRLEAYEAITKVAPFCFQKVGRKWVIRFTVAGFTKMGIFNDHRGLQHLAVLLANQDRLVRSVGLDGRNNDPEAMTIITSEKERQADRLFPHLTPDNLRDAYAHLKEQYAAAKKSGNFDAMIEFEDKIAKFEEQVGTDEKDFRRYALQKETWESLERIVHRSVSTNLRRAYTILRDGDMGECATYLKTQIQIEGYGFAYRPHPDFRPEWLL